MGGELGNNNRPIQKKRTNNLQQFSLFVKKSDCKNELAHDVINNNTLLAINGSSLFAEVRKL